MPRFRLALATLLFVWLAGSSPAAELPPRIFLAGDSTMADKPLDLPERGWGMALQQFCRATAMVQNHAVNGRSTKSFIDEERWQRIAAELRPGDFVIIQFAHNDEKKENPKVYADAATSYRDNLRRFIHEAQAKGATPVLATPVCRRKFENGKRVDTHGAYPDAMRAVAQAEHVALVDLERLTATWLEAEGPENSKRFFMWIAPGVYPKLPNGRQDDTHFVLAGANQVAELFAADVHRQKLPLAQWLKQP